MKEIEDILGENFPATERTLHGGRAGTEQALTASNFSHAAVYLNNVLLLKINQIQIKIELIERAVIIQYVSSLQNANLSVVFNMITVISTTVVFVG